MGTPIPEGIHYNLQHNNFYDANGKGMGDAFFRNWHSRSHEFPQQGVTVVTSPFKVGGTYKMVGGGEVTLISEHCPGKDHHTMACKDGIHRYVARKGDLGRVTGTPHNVPDPRNLVVPVTPISPADLLAKMADTYRERNKVYGDNWRNVGNVMMALFPDGIELLNADAFNRWHLFELIVVKLTRFANSRLTHADSIHDIAVYAAMIEAAIIEKGEVK